MTLVDFLRARFAEDEAVARVLLALPERELAARPDMVAMSEPLGRTFSASRMLAEVEAKGAIVSLYWTWPEDDYAEGRASMHDEVMSLLALPYADHPDYHEGWKP